jgi:DNA-binding NtrC family response regulator
MIEPNASLSRVRVLAVSPSDKDHTTLSHIFGHTSWDLECVRTLSEASRRLSETPAPVVICENILPDGDWKDMLSTARTLSDGCSVIVMSECADERLWAEVLNIGAYDVLAKPLLATEVFASVGQAWRHWLGSRKSATRAVSANAAAVAAVA